MTLNLAVTIGCIANLIWRHSTYAVSLGPLLLSAISLAALGVSGYLGRNSQDLWIGVSRDLLITS